MHDVLAHSESLLLGLFGPFAFLLAAWPYLVMVLGFSAIVFVHELGHFAVAKWAGVKVEKFAIGFGRELFGYTRGETRYSFNLLPLGGYVKMLGQEDFDDKSNEMKFNDDPRSFVNKPVSHRMAIVSAGVIMNVFFACFLFMIVFMVGMEAPGTRIALVVPDSPADRAGLLPGDEIKKINGEKILEFGEVRVAVMLAAKHEPLAFEVERNGELQRIAVKPEYLIPENTREARRQMVGIAPGVTSEIYRIGPDIDTTEADAPRPGDKLVEVDGKPVTDENAGVAVEALAYTTADVFVERPDPKNPDANPERIKVVIPPVLTIYPSELEDGTASINVLGLTPLLRVSEVDSRGRAALAGIEIGDTIVRWDGIENPNRHDIARAIYESPERDIHFQVLKRNRTISSGFVRPQSYRRGAATIQALLEPVDQPGRTGANRSVRFADVRPLGVADDAGIEAGDLILACDEMKNPSMAEVNRVIRKNPDRYVSLTLRKSDGTEAVVQVIPKRPGAIDAKFGLVADDLLRIGEVATTINGHPSPAALAGIESGSVITGVDDTAVTTWRALIQVLRRGAGSTVQLSYFDPAGQSQTCDFPVPHSLRTLIGIGPESRILSIDQRTTIDIQTSRGSENVAVGYRKGLSAILAELKGKTDVQVEYRANSAAPIQTATININEAMADPWLGRIALSPNVDVVPETTLLKGENVVDAVSIGLHKTYYFIQMVYRTLERMIFSRSVSVENISGPLGIIDLGSRVAQKGWVEFIFFMGIISANLAVINFLPLPIVDGGLMIFLIIEKIKGSPVSLRVQVATQMVGFFLIIGMFLYVTFNDAMRLWG